MSMISNPNKNKMILTTNRRVFVPCCTKASCCKMKVVVIVATKERTVLPLAG